MAQSSDPAERFIERGMHPTPEALEEIEDVPESSTDDILSDLDERKERPSVITDELVSKLLNSDETIPADSMVEYGSSEIGGGSSGRGKIRDCRGFGGVRIGGTSCGSRATPGCRSRTWESCLPSSVLWRRKRLSP